jgi:hypothetical protein
MFTDPVVLTTAVGDSCAAEFTETSEVVVTDGATING